MVKLLKCVYDVYIMLKWLLALVEEIVVLKVTLSSITSHFLETFMKGFVLTKLEPTTYRWKS